MAPPVAVGCTLLELLSAQIFGSGSCLGSAICVVGDRNGASGARHAIISSWIDDFELVSPTFGGSDFFLGAAGFAGCCVIHASSLRLMITLVRTVRSLRLEMPVVALSPDGGPRSTGWILDAGADDLFSSDVSPEEAEARIAGLIRRRLALRALCQRIPTETTGPRAANDRR